jgi:uncharacterized repeat protein (TIGR03803 family)
MRRFSSALCLLVMIVGCSRAPSTSSLLPDSPSHRVGGKTSSFKTVHAFAGDPDGANPGIGALAGIDDALFGTTQFGGDASDNCYPGVGCGTVFKVNAGKETVLYRFKNPANGLRPYGGLTDLNGTLYGTTQSGGKYNYGTVFSIASGGVEKVIYSFNGTDGSYPRGNLTSINGVLYGTTYFGGANGYGSVFSLTTGGAEKVLYSFQAGTDGALYGTTLAGGAEDDGIVFAVSSAGKEKVIHTFTGRPDGAQPYAGMIYLDGTLYGTTKKGGANDLGTVFKVASGEESVLYSFAGGNDGSYPVAGLTLLNSLIYGTTSAGGGTGGACSVGCGTIYTITTSGSESVLYSFTGESDGHSPYASLIAVGSTLAGTANAGGVHGDGTVFKFLP